MTLPINLHKGTLKFRFSNVADYDLLARFYGSNEDKDVAKRPDAVSRKSVEDGLFLIVEASDPNNSPIGIIASSAAYHYGDDINKPATEIGSTRVILGGFGLYPFLIASQVVDVEATNGTGSRLIMARVHEGGKVGRELLTGKPAWRDHTMDADLENASWSILTEGGHPYPASLDYYRSCPVMSLPAQRGIVKQLLTAETFTNKRTGEWFDVARDPALRARLERGLHPEA